MTPAQKKMRELRDRQSRERGRMAELGLADSLTAETRAEFDAIETGTPDLERQIRAATLAVEQEEGEQRQAAAAAEPDAELRERLELRSRASLGRYLEAALRGRLPSGAEAELAAAAGVEGIPIELWDVPAEHRADAPTPSPATVGVNLDPIRPQLFASSIAPRLGIDMPRVASGSYATATITTAMTAAPKAKGTTADSTAAAFTVTSATPKRVSARMSIRIEDVAAVGAANFESALRENLASALTAELDDQAINGSGTAPALAGMFSLLMDPSDPSNTTTFDLFLSGFASGIDGLWASTMSEVGVVANVESYQLAARAFRDAGDGAERGDMAFADYARMHTAGLWTNKRMPVAASGIAPAILYRTGRPGVRKAVCPHWGYVSVDDIYSGSAEGERYFTMHVLLGDVILVQPDAYSEIRFKVT